MAQYQDGDTKVINGVTYVRQGGVWVPQGGSASPDPAAPVTIGTPRPQTIAPAEAERLRLAREAAERAERAEARAQETHERTMSQPPPRPTGARTQAQTDELLARRNGVDAFENRVNEIENIYRTGLAGPERGGILGIGGDYNLGGRIAVPGVPRPVNERLDSAANALIGDIMQMQGTTGGEANSVAEIRIRFGPMLPQPGDSDEVVMDKIARLRAMAAEQRGTLQQLLGEESPETAPAAGSQSPGGDPPTIGGDRMTATDQRIVDPTQGNRVQITEQGYRSEDDPALAGVNARINRMMQQGASREDFAAFLRETGIPANEVMPSIESAMRWREQHPEYRGAYNVNIDDRHIPMSRTREIIADAANSDVGAAAIAAGNIVSGNHLDNIVEATGGNGALANIGMEQVREQNPYASFAGDILGGASLYMGGRGALNLLGRGAAPATGTFAGRAIGGDAAMGAYVGSGADGTNMFSAENALAGAALAVPSGMVGRGAVNALGRAVSPSGGELAAAYAEGVRPTLGQRMGGIVDRAEQAFQSVPGLGGIQRSGRAAARREWQAGGFNRALREIDDQLPEGVQSGTDAHAYMQRSFNRAYDRARSNMQMRQDGPLAADLGNIQREIDALSDTSQRVFFKEMETLGNRLRARQGVLSGDDYKAVTSRIDGRIRAIRKSSNGDLDLADRLEELSLALDAAARRHSAPEAVEALDAVDRGYASAVIIEEASRRAGGGETGEFTGKQLQAAIRGNSGRRSRQMLRGEHPMQDYAAAGARLGDEVPDSGTPERWATLTGMGALAHFVDPTMLVPWLADTVAASPVGRQSMNWLLAPNRRALDPARQRILERAHYGGLFLAAPTAGAVSQ